MGYAIDGQAVFHQLPAYMGRSFSKACNLFLIVNTVFVARYLDRAAGANAQPSLSLAETILQKLLCWADEDGIGIQEGGRHAHHLTTLQYVSWANPFQHRGHD